MPVPVLESNLLCVIGIAILAHMNAGVVFPNVLAGDAAAELTLSLVFCAGSRLHGVPSATKVEGSFGNTTEEIRLLDCHAQVTHEGVVVVCEPDDEVVVDAAVSDDMETGEVNSLATSRKGISPPLIEPG